MRITVQATGETLEVATGNRVGDEGKKAQALAASLICRIVRPRYTPASNRRVREFKKGHAAG